jgi:hypothetical protein
MYVKLYLMTLALSTAIVDFHYGNRRGNQNDLTEICIQAQTANIFARLFTFETGRLPLETEMFHRSCDVSH